MRRSARWSGICARQRHVTRQCSTGSCAKARRLRSCGAQPAEFKGMPWKEQRLELLEALAFGYGQRKSPYFHCTGSLEKAIDLWHERGRSYSDNLIRFPQTVVAREHGLAWTDCILRTELVNQVPSDTETVRKAVQRIQGYMAKDKEVVMKTRPDLKDIDYWNGDTKCWLPAASWVPRGQVFGGGLALGGGWVVKVVSVPNV